LAEYAELAGRIFAVQDELYSMGLVKGIIYEFLQLKIKFYYHLAPRRGFGAFQVDPLMKEKALSPQPCIFFVQFTSVMEG
jgi:hypothetical protein